MEHTIYLAADDFIKGVGPKTKTWNKMWKVCVEDQDEDEDEDEDDGDWIADWNKLELIDDGEEVDDEIDFLAGDVLGKVLALVNQVSFLFSHLVIL
jgi:hypothetical protein